jgi:phospholipase C
MNRRVLLALMAGCPALLSAAAARAEVADRIDTIVVIYAENRSFDSLYGNFPGAHGLKGVKPSQYLQRDRDGTVLKELPPIWGGLTGNGVTPPITEAQTAHLPNRPFAVDDPQGFNLPLSIETRDLWHLFYQNQMQINGGKNDKFAAWADSGGQVMGHYERDPSKLPLWKIAQKYTLADNFFQGAFGGSFLNHFFMVCSCTPVYPNADTSPAKGKIAAVEADGVTLKVTGPSSALTTQPGAVFVNNGAITPDFFAVNTMGPPYQPSFVPADPANPLLADKTNASYLPPQSMTTIGDLMSARHISWAWYGGAWQAALDHVANTPAPGAVPNFQFHHQPFNYFVKYAPGTAARTEHLRDGGLAGVEFIKAIDAGNLPHVTFYKPQGNLNEHAGYTDVLQGDTHIADVISHLEKSKQWPHMLVVVTYDENGGWWDHIAPPKGDRWGPGSRVPALIISPYAKRGYVDHTFYDTTSIIRFVTHRYDLPELPGIKERDAALKKNHSPRLGDLTNALAFGH